jgi:hypothetical protein
MGFVWKKIPLWAVTLFSYYQAVGCRQSALGMAKL